MKIVIDIPKYIYEHAKVQSEDSNDEWDAMRAIANGTPLPKGHGRLIDADALMKSYSQFEFCSDMGDAMEILDNVPSIIEADKEEENETDN